MLLTLRNKTECGALPSDQIKAFFKGALTLDAWPDNVRPSEVIFSELLGVVNAAPFEELLTVFHALLYVGRLTEVPNNVDKSFLVNWDSDWLIVLTSRLDSDINYCLVPTTLTNLRVLH